MLGMMTSKDDDHVSHTLPYFTLTVAIAIAIAIARVSGRLAYLTLPTLTQSTRIIITTFITLYLIIQFFRTPFNAFQYLFLTLQLLLPQFENLREHNSHRHHDCWLCPSHWVSLTSKLRASSILIHYQRHRLHRILHCSCPT